MSTLITNSDDLTRFTAVFSTRDLAPDIAPRLSCTEVEALAGLLRALGEPATADTRIQEHATDDEIGDVHTPQHFNASIDEWQGAVAGAAIRHRIEKRENGETTVLACYDFPSNDTLMRETFTVAGGRIVASTQTAVAQDCSGY